MRLVASMLVVALLALVTLLWLMHRTTLGKHLCTLVSMKTVVDINSDDAPILIVDISFLE